jgi:hypothetical protein
MRSTVADLRDLAPAAGAAAWPQGGAATPMISVARARARLEHINAVHDKRAVESRIAESRQRYLAAMRANDELQKRLLDVQFREQLLPEFERAAAAERQARAALQELAA